MTPIFQHVIALLGRVLLSLIFLLSGAHHIVDWAGTVAHMRSKGVALEHLLGANGGTFFVHLMLALAIIFLLAGGLSVLLGFRARWGAVSLLLFLAPTTLIFHNFWSPGVADAQAQMIHFMKNLGLAGGLLMVLAFGSGGFSVDTFLPQLPRQGR